MKDDRPSVPKTREIEQALAALRMPARIGPYAILDVLGEGGMGTVFLAEEADASRRVALKVIKPGMDSREVLRRFRYEQKTLAGMSHDAIAKVFTFGATEQQLPYFVMEWVDGLPLDQYCEQWRLGLTARLRLVREICAGVQHAHERGAVHRDLKPGNVLVARQGDAHRPKVIDFGLARALERDRGETATAENQVLGTIEYMAPEQLVGDHPAGIGVHTDVWALGVMLYQLVTDALPLPDLRARRLDEQVKLIAEREPPTVGARVAADLAARAAVLQVAPRALSRVARRELTWIAAKAMHKDPARRYPSAAALAEDLRRLLDGEAVVAGPDRVSYRVSKFLRRRWLESAAAFAVGMALVVAVGAIVVGAEQARASNVRAQLTNAKLALERGDWAQALTAFAEAEAMGDVDAVDVTIGRIVAHTGAFDDRAATAELRRLASLSARPEQQGRVLLLRGLFANRAADPDAGLGDVREAVRVGGLTDSQRELANYLLADTFDDAWGAIHRAVAADSHDRLANLAMLSLLLCSGHADEMARFGEQLGALYPKDPIRAVPELLQALVSGRVDSADLVARDLAGDDDEFADVLEELAKSSQKLSVVDDQIVRFVFDRDEFGTLQSFQMSAQCALALSFLARFHAVSVGDGRARVMQTLGSVVPPCVAKGYREPLRLLRMALENRKDVPSAAEDALVRDVMQTAADQTGLAMPRFFCGFLHAMRGEHTEALAEYERAAHAGVLIPVSRSIDRGIVASSYRLWQDADAAQRAAHAERALAAIRRLLPKARRAEAFRQFLRVAADLDASGGAVASTIAAWRSHPDFGDDEEPIRAAIDAELERHRGQPIARFLEAARLR